jgi:Cu2+-exporting ATPase
MDKKNQHENHHDHHKMMMKDFKKRFIISIILTIPILVLSPLIQQFLGIEITFNGSNYIYLFYHLTYFSTADGRF